MFVNDFLMNPEAFSESLVLRLGPEAGDAAALVVGLEGEVQADGVVDAADEAHAGVGLFLHDVFSGRYGISVLSEL